MLSGTACIIRIFKGLVPSELYAQIPAAGVSQLPKELVKLVDFLKAQPQVKYKKWGRIVTGSVDQLYLF